MGFPKDFVWGAAASSYQIEGGATQDGRGKSIWDVFARTPDKVLMGHTGDVACDHYNRYQEDVGLLGTIGAKAYRLSIAWPRVIPEGTGAVNEKGLAFYDRLVDALLGAGITPYVTIFHWDYPYPLYLRGGWLNRECVEWFAEYTKVVVDRLSDRVRHWMTLNEPQCFVKFGHGDGLNAPGLRLPMSEQLLALHHALLAHGRGVQVIRARAKTPPIVGWAPVCVTHYPATGSEADIGAARSVFGGIEKRDLWNNSVYNDPILRGAYPEDAYRVYGADMPEVRAGDMETMRQPIDFIGVNIYEGTPVRAGADGKPEVVPRATGFPTTAFRWPVEPESLHWGPRFMHERYGLPIYVTENGLSSMDWVSMDGKVHDPNRVDFTRRYLLALRRASEAGVDVRGYFHWSLMDNFEWAEGYRQRFGLVHVDFETLKRTPKDSAHWYRRVIETNGAALDAD